MTRYPLLLAAALLAASACSDGSPGTDAGPDASGDATTQDAGGDASAQDGAASDDGATEDASAEDASADDGAVDDGGGIDDDGGLDDGGEDASTPDYVSSNVVASITVQWEPDDENTPARLEFGTLSYYPVMFTNPEVTAPPGFFLSGVEEIVSSRRCPNDATPARCLQHFRMLVYPDPGVCQLAGQYQVSLDVTCAPGGDCARIDPAFTTLPFTPTYNSGNYCEAGYDTGFDLFRPTAAVYQRNPPAEAGGSAEIRVFTTTDLPYLLTTPTVTAPAGFTIGAVTMLDESCPDAEHPTKCRRWWSVMLDPDEGTCSLAGDYAFAFGVECADGGNCDPSIDAYAPASSLPHLDICP